MSPPPCSCPASGPAGDSTGCPRHPVAVSPTCMMVSLHPHELSLQASGERLQIQMSPRGGRGPRRRPRGFHRPQGGGGENKGVYLAQLYCQATRRRGLRDGCGCRRTRSGGIFIPSGAFPVCYAVLMLVFLPPSPPAPSNQSVVSELSDPLQLESCLHGEIIKFWGENLSKEELLTWSP